jgi:hypothetical protein
MSMFPAFPILDDDKVDVLTCVIEAWCQKNQIDPESECACAVAAIALDLLAAGYDTPERLSIALANALHSDV